MDQTTVISRRIETCMQATRAIIVIPRLSTVSIVDMLLVQEIRETEGGVSLGKEVKAAQVAVLILITLQHHRRT